jgi:hypothetical protein
MALSTTQRRHMRELVRVLRTTRRKQGNGQLHVIQTKDGQAPVHKYCCLGIACEVAIKEGLKLSRKTKNVADYLNVISYVQKDGTANDVFLPPDAAAFFGIEERHYGDPRLDIVGLEEYPPDPWLRKYSYLRPTSASSLNDKNGWNFKQIADAFEKTFLPKDWAKTVKSREKTR